MNMKKFNLNLIFLIKMNKFPRFWLCKKTMKYMKNKKNKLINLVITKSVKKIKKINFYIILNLQIRIFWICMNLFYIYALEIWL